MPHGTVAGASTRVGSSISGILSGLSSPLTARSPQLGKLSLNVTPKDDSVQALSAGDAAAKRADLTISNAALSVTSREALTSSQLNSVNAILDIARTVKNETDADRAATLATEAQSLVTQANAAYSDASSRDPNIAESTTFIAPVNREIPQGTSGHLFSATVSAVPSLADLGVSSTLALDSASVDGTIASLENAQASLRNKLDGFESSRLELVQAVQKQRNIATQSDRAPQNIADATELAKRFQSQLQAATTDVVAHRFEDLNAPALLVTELLTPKNKP